MNPVVRTVIFTLVVPGTVTVLVPHWILPPRAQFLLGGYGLLGMSLLGAGMAIYLWCAFWAFALVGQGTPAPIDAPKRLVVHGLYRYVRNPIYWGVSFILGGEAIMFRSWVLVRYAIGFWLLAHLFVLLYEEPTLRRKFGAQYEEYCRNTPRWLPLPRKLK